MQTKVFEGKTYREAYSKLKLELGPDAIIIDQREIMKGGFLGLFGTKIYEIVGMQGTNFKVPPIRTFKSENSEKKKTEDLLQTNKDQILSVLNRKKAFKSYSNISNKTLDLSNSDVVAGNVNKELAELKKLILCLNKKVEGIVSNKDESQECQSGAIFGRIKNDIKDTMPKNLKMIWECLCENDFCHNLSNRVMHSLKDIKDISDMKNVLNEFVKVLESRCNFFEKEKESKSLGQPKIIFLVGPTGVGKTTTLQKLAAPFAIRNKDVGLITIDTYRLAAPEQLEAYASVIDVPVLTAFSKEELHGFVDNYSNKDYIFIDTVGRSPSDIAEIKEISSFIKELRMNTEVQLVISATTKEKDILKIINNFKILDFDKIIFTKLDETYTLGPIFNIMQSCKVPISYFTNGQNVASDIMKADKKKFVKHFMKLNFKKMSEKKIKAKSEKIITPVKTKVENNE